MTIKERRYFQNVSQKKKIVVLESQKEKLIEAAPEELLVQGGRRKKQWNGTTHQWDAALRANGSQTAELSPQGCEVGRQVEDERVCRSEERLLVEGGDNRLLILANSAELMSESEDSLRRVHVNRQGYEDKNWDKVGEVTLIAHERSEKDGSHCEGKVPRLSQIQHQGCLKSQSFMQQSIQEDTCGCMQRSKTRLTQIRRLARSGNHVLGKEDSAGCSHGKLPGGITRLSQIRRQARSTNNCSLQERIEEHMHRHLDCQYHEDLQMVDAAAEQCAKLDSCQVIGTSSSSCSDAENVDKMICEKGTLRLSQLRRKARLGNADLVAKRNTG
ncbi:uncharacterized protein LOC110428358 isoform X2 [Herrania umbratica]|uniref:Uncharacterized protein LOC110428358 isoform X2 n=1 Tax=Herrania umbratica TaxID=108875 RepID=A0A6J1BL80_9ROSI|nr:uncharacterized protein LOC110428358 isoform X2 [Herrania umbratica]